MKLLCWIMLPFFSAQALIAQDLPTLAFEGPGVVKLDWSVRSLRVCDLNGDGLTDLAVINNDLAKIELLLQQSGDDESAPTKRRRPGNRWEPVLEDARFIVEGVDLGFAAFDLAVGDLDGDGLDDLAYTATESPLTIRYQDAEGNWARTDEFDLFEALGWTGSILIDDLEGDGSSELVVMASDAVYVFDWSDGGTPHAPAVYPLAGENPFNLLLRDVDGNGGKDLVYITANGAQSLVLRLQAEDGRFGPELRFPLERPVRRVVDFAVDEADALRFASVDARSGALEFFRLRPSEDADLAAGESDPHPEVYPILKKGRQPARYALGDFDGDGRKDIVVSNPASAEKALYLREDERFAPPDSFPSFANISSLAAGRFDESLRDAIVVVSAEEKSLGVSRVTDTGRLSFPAEIILGSGEPLVCAAVDPDGDGRNELALVTRESGSFRFLLVRPVDNDGEEVSWEVVSDTELPGVRREPEGILELDVLGDGGQAIMVLVPREPPVLLRATGEAPFSFEAFAEDSSLRQNLLDGVPAAGISCVDLDGDGVQELVVCRQGYARAVRISGNGLEMVDQFNARRSDDEVSAAIPVGNGDGLSRLLFFVADAGELQVLERDQDGVLRYRRSIDVGTLDILQWSWLEGEALPTGPLLFAGDDRFWILRADGNRWERVIDGRYETDLEDVAYSHLEGTDFDGDGSVDLLAVDGKSHVLEILGEDGDNWQSRVFWEVFEQNLHYQGRKGGNFEPREVVTGDFSGDGRTDFALLIHDRVLVYTRSD